ncbi:hypothetical protein LXL04_021381 [Taraxacum kok-saghyz]
MCLSITLLLKKSMENSRSFKNSRRKKEEERASKDTPAYKGVSIIRLRNIMEDPSKTPILEHRCRKMMQLSCLIGLTHTYEAPVLSQNKVRGLEDAKPRLRNRCCTQAVADLPLSDIPPQSEAEKALRSRNTGSGYDFNAEKMVKRSKVFDGEAVGKCISEVSEKGRIVAGEDNVIDRDRKVRHDIIVIVDEKRGINHGFPKAEGEKELCVFHIPRFRSLV